MTELQMTEVLVVAGAGTYLVCSIFTRLPYCVASCSFLLVLFFLHKFCALQTTIFTSARENARTARSVCAVLFICLCLLIEFANEKV